MIIIDEENHFVAKFSQENKKNAQDYHSINI